MIKTENYGAGVRWYCTECDELYNEHGRLTIHYTNSTPPADCQRCGEEAMLVIWGQNRPNFVSMVLTRREAAVLQRTMQEGTIVSVGETRKPVIMDRISMTLPYPPSVNHYWKTRVLRRGARYVPQVYVSPDGQRYQRTVAKVLDGVPRFNGQLRVQILVQPPDGRARDLDNVLKCLLDSLTKAGVWHDDQQIDSLLVVRGEPTSGGTVIVLVETSQQETEE